MKRIALLGLAFAAVGKLSCVQAQWLEPVPIDQHPGWPPSAGQAISIAQVELGLGWLSDDADRFGRYGGVRDEGLFALLGLDWLKLGAWDDPDPWRIELALANLDTDSRSGYLALTRPGRFGFWAEVRDNRLFHASDAATIYRRDDATDLKLPDDWVAGATTADLARLLPSLVPVEFEHQRRRAGLGGRWFSGDWSFDAAFREERRDGTRPMAGLIGNTGGNPRAVLLPAPIDYRTRQFDASADYADRRRHFRIGYHASHFSNANAALAWDNPFSAIGGWHPSAGFPAGRGQLALPPDNQFHQLNLGVGHQLGPRVRLVTDLAMGRMTQDEDLLAMTINPVLADSVEVPVPIDSLDGRIETTNALVRLVTRPTTALSLNFSYRYDDRDNRTRRNEFVYIGGDSQLQDTAITSSRRRFNLPVSYRDQQFAIDAAWRLNARGRVEAGYRHRRTERTFSAREKTDENTFIVGFRRQWADWLSTNLRAEFADRGGSTYDGAAPFVSGHAAEYIETVAGGWGNHPGLRQYHLADRRRQQGSVSAVFSPHAQWQGSITGHVARDDYRRSEIGLTDAETAAWTMDVAYTPEQWVSLWAFYSYEYQRFDQAGQSIRGFNRLGDLADPERLWETAQRDRVNTVGAGLTTRWLDDRLELRADYVHAAGRARLRFVAGDALPTAPVPDISTRLNSFSVDARYRASQTMTLRLGWRNERFASADWAFDDIGVDQLARVILTGEGNPGYRVNLLTAAVVIHF